MGTLYINPPFPHHAQYPTISALKPNTPAFPPSYAKPHHPLPHTQCATQLIDKICVITSFNKLSWLIFSITAMLKRTCVWRNIRNMPLSFKKIDLEMNIRLEALR